MSQTLISYTKTFAGPPPLHYQEGVLSCAGAFTSTRAQTKHRFEHTYCHVQHHKQKPGGPLHVSNDTSRLLSHSTNQPLADPCVQTQLTLLWTMDPLGTGHKISHAQLPGSQALPTLTHRDTLVQTYFLGSQTHNTHCTTYTEATTGHGQTGHPYKKKKSSLSVWLRQSIHLVPPRPPNRPCV